MVHVGLDVHHRLYIIALLESGQRRARTVRVRGSIDRLLACLGQEAAGRPMSICFEASCDYGVLYERLGEVAERVVVAHPAHLRAIYRTKRKNDKVDATKLAKLLALDLVPTVWVPGLDVRSWRALIGHRRSLIVQRTACKNQLRALLRTHAIKACANPWAKCRRDWWGQRPWPAPMVGWQVDQLLMQLDHLEQMVRAATRQLDRIGRRHPGVTLLRTMPGVGPRTAEALVAWIDQADRFDRSKQVGAYFGLVPCQDQSASRNRLGHITKEGPAAVRQLLVEAAWVATQKDRRLGQMFQRIVGDDAGRKKIAIVAVARQMAVIARAMLRSGEAYRPCEEEQASAQRAAA